MPNPLTAAIASPTAAAKPDAPAPERREQQGAASFQTVMDQEADQQSGEMETLEPQVQDPDPDSELEEIVAASDQMDISEDQLPADSKISMPEIAPVQSIADRSVAPVLPPPAETVNEVSMPDTPPGTPDSKAARSPEIPAQSVGLPPFQASVPGSGTAQRRTGAAFNSQEIVMVATLPEAARAAAPTVPPPFEPRQDVSPGLLPPTSAPKQPVLPDRAPTLVQMQLLATEPGGEATEALANPDFKDVRAVRETPVFSPTREAGQIVPSPSATARAETARAIAGQMAVAISTRPQSGAIEIALNPEELGRVSIVLNGRDDGLHMTIAAERPETLETMRRHLSVLEAEFQNLGLGALSIDLGTSSDAERDEAETEDQTPSRASGPEHIAETDPALSKNGPDGRIDLRL